MFPHHAGACFVRALLIYVYLVSLFEAASNAYFRVFFGSIFFQLKQKFSARAHAEAEAKKGEKPLNSYNRYSDTLILAGDRAVGNFLEWQVAFLSLFWLNAALTGTNVWVGWVFIGARALYLVFAKSAIRPQGIKPHLLLATVPGYLVLFFYIYTVTRAVL